MIIGETPHRIGDSTAAYLEVTWMMCCSDGMDYFGMTLGRTQQSFWRPM